MCCVLGQDTHTASLHPGVQMGTGEFNTEGDPVMDYIASYSIGSRNTSNTVIPSCYRNRDKLRPDPWTTWLVCMFNIPSRFNNEEVDSPTTLDEYSVLGALDRDM